MQLNKEATIYDIAEKLQLSSSIISRALRNHPGVKSETRRKIVETAQSLGYRHNSFASLINSDKTKTIGIIVPKLNSSFIVSVIGGIEKIMAEAGYATIITHSNESYNKEVANTENLFHRRVDGLIVSLSNTDSGLAHFEPFENRNIPIVFFDKVPKEKACTNVIIDNYQCGYDATRHLIEQGCKKIVLVTGNLDVSVNHLRHKGYKDALNSFHLPYQKKRVIINSLNEESGEQAALEILKMRPLPDGIFITNDFAAAICLQALKQNGIKIPQDMAIVGFNNDPVCQIVEPQLSTINYPGANLGEDAAKLLLNNLNALPGQSSPGTVVMEAGLVIRNSSLKKTVGVTG
ncbi:MAG: LacI family DNA-binding transcriptional regulator [Ferruginibacter sp.]